MNAGIMIATQRLVCNTAMVDSGCLRDFYESREFVDPKCTLLLCNEPILY